MLLNILTWAIHKNYFHNFSTPQKPFLSSLFFFYKKKEEKEMEKEKHTVGRQPGQPEWAGPATYHPPARPNPLALSLCPAGPSRQVVVTVLSPKAGGARAPCPSTSRVPSYLLPLPPYLPRARTLAPLLSSPPPPVLLLSQIPSDPLSESRRPLNFLTEQRWPGVDRLAAVARVVVEPARARERNRLTSCSFFASRSGAEELRRAVDELVRAAV